MKNMHVDTNLFLFFVMYNWQLPHFFSAFSFQTKGKSQTTTVSDIEKYLSTAEIKNFRNTEFQKYKVRYERCLQRSISAVCYVIIVLVQPLPWLSIHAKFEQQIHPDFRSKYSWVFTERFSNNKSAVEGKPLQSLNDTGCARTRTSTHTYMVADLQ